MLNEAMSKVRDYIALLMTLGMLIFVGFHVAIPDRLWDVYLAIIMFFFGSKTADKVPDQTMKILLIISLIVLSGCASY